MTPRPVQCTCGHSSWLHTDNKDGTVGACHKRDADGTRCECSAFAEAKR